MKRAFTLLEAMIVLFVVAALAAFLWPVIARFNAPKRYVSCQSNLKQIGLGLLIYGQDYDDKFPFAHMSSSVGWADMLQPYVKSRQLFLCPTTQNLSLSTSDYFYNRRLSRVLLAKIKHPSSIIMIGDGEEAAPTWNSWMGFPADAATNPDSPCRRQMDGANYGFVDGHIKYLKPHDLSRQTKWNPLTP